MKYQPPSEGIMLNYNYANTTSFTVGCTCMNPDDRVNVLVETDEFGEITVIFEVEAKTLWWETLCSWDVYKIDNEFLYIIANSIKSLINGIYQRVKLTKDIWWNGYLKLQTNTILDKQRALNFYETLKNAIEHLEKKDGK